MQKEVEETLEYFRSLPDLTGFTDISRSSTYGNATGSYKQVVNADRTVISPGDRLIVDYLITGYGSISGAKLYYSPSADVFTDKSSFIDNMVAKKDGSGYETRSKTITARNFYIHLSAKGVNRTDKEYTTIFHSNLPYSETKGLKTLESEFLVTEIYERSGSKLGPPFGFNLVTKKDVKPGIYKLNFVLTYYNGSEIVQDVETVDFKVMAWYERQAGWIEGAAWVVAILTILTSFIVLGEFIYKIVKS